MSDPHDPMNSEQASRSADGPDPELIELPSPRRPFRRLTLVTLSLTIAAAIAMVVGLAGDLRYSLEPGQVIDVGPLTNLQPRRELLNGWVRGEGELESVGGIRFERPLEADSFRLAPLQGNPKLWVQVRVPKGYENEHFVAPTVFSGRLVPLASLGLRYQTLALAPEAAGWKTGHLADDAWLLIDGETPKNTRWVWGLSGLFFGFALFSVWGLVALLRPAAVARVTSPEPAT